MKRKKVCWRQSGTKISALLISLALSMSSLSVTMPGSMAAAQETQTEEAATDSDVEANNAEVDETGEVLTDSESEMFDVEEKDTEDVASDSDSEEIQVEEVPEETINAELNKSDIELPSEDEANGAEAGLLGTSNAASYVGGVKVWGYLEGDIGPEPVEFGFQGSYIQIVHDGDDMYPKRVDDGPPIKAEVNDGMYSAYVFNETEYDIVTLNKYYEITPITEEETSADVFPHDDDEIRLDLNLARKKKEVEGIVKNGPEDTSYKIVFVDDEDGERTEAIVDDEVFSAELVTGRTYTVSVDGISGYSVSKEKLKLEDNQEKVTIQLRKERFFDAEKGDSWDFALGFVDGYDDSEYYEYVYNSRLDEQTINDFYRWLKDGSIGFCISSFTLDDGDFEFYNGGNPAKLYSKNSDISRYADENYGGFDGYLLCNNVTGNKPYVIIDCQKDQVVTVYYAKEEYGQYPEMSVAGLSSSSMSSIESKSADGCFSFVVPESGKYKIYSKNDYFGFKEIRREYYIHVSGKVYAPMGPLPSKQFSLFFNDIEVPVIDGNYDAMLPKQGCWRFHRYYRYRKPYYKLSLSEEAYGFDLATPKEQFNIEAGGAFLGDPEEYIPPYNLYIDNKNTENCDIPIYPEKYYGCIYKKLYGAPEDYLMKLETEPGYIVRWELISSPSYSGKDIGSVWCNDIGDWIEYSYYPGEYLVTLMNEKTGFVYSRKIVSGHEDIDVTYGDYENRDREARVFCNVEGVTTEELDEAVFWFTSTDHIDGYCDGGSYRSYDMGIDELSYGIARLPKGHKFVLHASGLPEGMALAEGKQINLSEENCVDGQYLFTVQVRPANQEYSLDDFGAKGDGVTDDTEAVQRALEAANGGKLYVPAGKYCVSYVDVSDISVEMYSDEDAVFYKTDSTDKQIIKLDNCSNCKISGISFDAGAERLGEGSNTSCVSFNNASKIEISNCKFSDSAYGALSFFENCEDISVSDNKFNKVYGAIVIGKGTVRHVVFEDNVAYGGEGNAVSILEQGKATESFDIVIRKNVFHNFTTGSVVQLRNVSDVRIENNYANGCKYLLMSPKPLSKNFTEPHVSDVRMEGNSGSVTNYVRLYTYAENPNAVYKNISFAENSFAATSGLEAYACDGISFSNDKLNISGSASLKFFDSQNIELNGLTVDTKKSSKPIFKLDACDDVKLEDISNSVDRVLLQITNSDNARVNFENVKSDFSKLDKTLLYSDGLQVKANNCTNTGKAIEAYMSDGKKVMIPIIGSEFTISSDADVNISTIHASFEKGINLTLRCETHDVFLNKGGNILVNDTVRFPKGSAINLEYNGKKWALKNTPVTITNSEDATAAVGEKVNFNVKVSGGSGQYAYRWFVSYDDGKTWKKSSYSGSKKVTVSFVVSEKTYTYKFRCRVTDSATGEEYYSNNMKVIAPEPESFIKTQPKDYQAKAGENAIYTVEVNGKAKSYQWYKSKGEGKPWQKLFCTGARTNKLEIPVEKYMNNYLIYCVIKDADGNEYSTDTAKIILIK